MSDRSVPDPQDPGRPVNDEPVRNKERRRLARPTWTPERPFKIIVGLTIVAVVVLVSVSKQDRDAATAAASSMRPFVPYFILILALFGVAVFTLPPRAVGRRITALRGTVGADKQIEAENSFRSALFQAVGSALLVLGFVVTWLQLDQSREQAEAANKQSQEQLKQNETQLALARNGQVAERFSRAMEQLGNDKTDVRMGGIYALESLLEELEAEQSTFTSNPSRSASEADRRASTRMSGAIVEILTGYVKSRTRVGQSRPHPGPELDVQAVLTILGRHAGRLSTAIQLTETDLRGYRLAGCVAVGDECARFDRADFTDSDLRRVDFIETTLQGAKFPRVHLEQARLQRANLADANFLGAHLAETDFTGADMTGAVLRGTDLARAILAGADLARADLADAVLDRADFREARLAGADLSTANLTNANLTGARADAATKWPPNFDPRAAGVVVA